MNPLSDTVRIHSPEELAACAPYLLGFHPTDSIVLLGIRGKALGPILRVDIPPRRHLGAIIEQCFTSLSPHSDAVVLVVYGSDTDHQRIAAVAAELAPRFGLAISLTCAADQISDSVVPAWTRDYLEQELVAKGRAVLGSRDELVDSIAGPTGDQAEQTLARFAVRCAAVVRSTELAGPQFYRQQQLRIGREILAVVEDHFHPRTGVPVDYALDLAAAVGQHVLVRDALIGDLLALTPDDRQRWLPILVSVVSQLPDELAVDLLAILGALAYRCGEGALARCALDRGEQIDPLHRLTELFHNIITAGLPPTELDAMASELFVDALALQDDLGWSDDE